MNAWLRVRSELDRLASVVLIMVLAPVATALSIRIRAGDGPPTLVRLPRVGRGGKVFSMHKFRTMSVGDHGGLALGQRLTVANDERITRSGNWLRRNRLDELPQLLDVCLGRMALVGPRPEAPEFVDLTDPAWQTVLVARPGIAGSTQLLVADLETRILNNPLRVDVYLTDLLPLKLDLDRFYIEHASAMLDVRIVIDLVGRIVGGRGPMMVRAYLRRHNVLLYNRLNAFSEEW